MKKVDKNQSVKDTGALKFTVHIPLFFSMLTFRRTTQDLIIKSN